MISAFFQTHRDGPEEQLHLCVLPDRIAPVGSRSLPIAASGTWKRICGRLCASAVCATDEAQIEEIGACVGDTRAREENQTAMGTLKFHVQATNSASDGPQG